MYLASYPIVMNVLEKNGTDLHEVYFEETT